MSLMLKASLKARICRDLDGPGCRLFYRCTAAWPELKATVWSSCPGSFWRSMHRRIGWLRLTPWSILSSKDGPASKMWPGCSVARCARCARCAGTSNNSGMAAWRLWAAPADTPKGAGACEQHTLALIGRLKAQGYSNREITRRTGVSEIAIRKVLRRLGQRRAGQDAARNTRPDQQGNCEAGC